MEQIFSIFCGQNPDHTWMPGGSLLPFCQRCTGLLAGALISMLLHACFRPRFTSRFLGVHFVLILAMAPFGFHWVPQGAILRTLTGIWFAFGVVTLLLLLPRQWLALNEPRGTQSLYWGGLMGACLLVPGLAALGGTSSATILKCLGFGGALVLAGLVFTNVALTLAASVRILCRALRHRPAP